MSKVTDLVTITTTDTSFSAIVLISVEEHFYVYRLI